MSKKIADLCGEVTDAIEEDKLDLQRRRPCGCIRNADGKFERERKCDEYKPPGGRFRLRCRQSQFLEKFSPM